MYHRNFPWLLMGLTLVILIMSACSSGGAQQVFPPQQPNSTIPTKPISSPRATARPLPDLTITRVIIDSPPSGAGGTKYLSRGLTYTFKVEVTNVGQGAMQGLVTVGYSYGCPGQGIAGRQLSVGQNLAPGESRVSDSFSITLKTETGGKCNFTFMVDEFNLETESNESTVSNTSEQLFEVP